MGKDSLTAMAEQVRSRQLQQQVAALSQRVNAQRCVAAFLGSNEDMLRAEVESLKQVLALPLRRHISECFVFLGALSGFALLPWLISGSA